MSIRHSSDKTPNLDTMGLNTMGLNTMGLNTMGLNTLGLNTLELNTLELNTRWLNNLGVKLISANHELGAIVSGVILGPERKITALF
jgi:hypothetical protein